MTDRLDLRTLNRTTLRRHSLLSRSDGSTAETVTRLMGLQGQNPDDPYYALWSRLAEFDPDGLGGMVERGEMVRGQLMRGTIHLVTRKQYRRWRPVYEPLCARILSGTRFGKETGLIDPRPPADTGDRAPRGESPDPGRVGRPARSDVPRHPPGLTRPDRHLSDARGPGTATWVWGRTGPARWALLEPGPLDDTAAEDIVVGYLGVFGPTSVSDIRVWSGLTGLRTVVDRLRHRLRVYQGPNGGELLDLAEGEIADPDIPAPPRLLPEYDNVLLGYQDRTRFMAPAGAQPVGWAGSLLIDGVFAGHWRLSRGVLEVTIGSKVNNGQRGEVVEEAERLASWVTPTHGQVRVVVTG
ncbi:MAG: winged helix DNA-binding domain-containing protein [Actinobacteria bacterium]|nr:winged helix DNA-binding domain-containing protein [Actinomycetota bacterium]